MPKSTRPERVFADSIEDAIVIEYFVLDCVESGSAQYFNDTSSQKKEIKIHTGAIRDDADICKMAKKVMRKCTVIPHQWISRVEDILYEIQQRALEDNMNGAKDGDNTRSNTNRKSNIDPTLNDILASLYGEADEQISSIKKVLSLCNNEKEDNVEAICEHQQLMSAMTRILGDESSSYSSDLTLHICQVFLSISEHEELHPTLVAFRVGSLILVVARSEVQKVEALGKDARSTAVMLTLDTCLSILMRLSNDVSLMRKMIKKDLLAIIHDCLVMDGIPFPTLEVIVHMLHKASGNAFEASVAFFIKTNTDTMKINRCEAIAKLVVVMIGRKKLSSCGRDLDNIVAHSLGSLFNLSFDANCRDFILESGIGRCLPNLLRHSDVDTHLMSLGLMYNLTISPEGPRVLYFKEMVRTVVKLIHKCASASECLSARLGAVLVNLTCSHIWAEALIPHVGEYILQIKTRKDVMLAKVVKNIASWTRSLQVCIGIAHTTNNTNCLLQITSNPSKYYIANNRHSGDELGVLQESYIQYQKHQFWDDCINPLLNMVSTSNIMYEIKLEIIGTLSNLTRFDVGPSETWDSLISEYSLVKVMSEIMSPVDMAESKGSQEELLLSMKVAVVVFCNQLCYCSTAAAKLVANTNLIHDLVNLWGEYEYAPNDHLEMVHFHVLSLCETLLQYEETRSIVLFGTEAMQFIFDSLENENLDLHLVARRCLDLLADYSGTSNALQDGIEESFASLGKERRFMIHNKKWLKEISNLTNT